MPQDGRNTGKESLGHPASCHGVPVIFGGNPARPASLFATAPWLAAQDLSPDEISRLWPGPLRHAERAADWPVPTLLLYAGADRCVAAAGSAGFAAAAPQARVAAHEFRALFHEIFNEPEQAEVFGVLHEWLQALVPAWAASCTGR